MYKSLLCGGGCFSHKKHVKTFGSSEWIWGGNRRGCQWVELQLQLLKKTYQIKYLLNSNKITKERIQRRRWKSWGKTLHKPYFGEAYERGKIGIKRCQSFMCTCLDVQKYCKHTTENLSRGMFILCKERNKWWQLNWLVCSATLFYAKQELEFSEIQRRIAKLRIVHFAWGAKKRRAREL